HTQSLRNRAKFHRAILERVVFAENEHISLIQVRNDRFIPCQAAALRSSSLQTNPCKEPGSQSQVLIRKSGPQANRSCRGTDLIVHKAQPADVRKTVFIRQAQECRAGQFARTWPMDLRDMGILQVRLLVDIEVDIDRIERN